MKRTYTLFQQSTATVLLVGLLLQSCGNFSSLPLPNKEKQKEGFQAHPQPIISANNIGPLVEQQLTADGGYLITPYEYKGKLQASVEVVDEKDKVYNGVPIEVKKGTDVVSLPYLPKKVQAGRIHIQKNSKDKPIKVIIHEGTGLMGGGDSEDEGEEEGTYQVVGKNSEDKESRSLEEQVTRLFVDIDTLIEVYLINNKQEKYKEELIKKKLEEVRKSFDELEVEESEQLGYFRYLYYIKNTAYLKALGKEKEAATQKKLAERLKKFAKEKEVKSKVEPKKEEQPGFNTRKNKGKEKVDDEELNGLGNNEPYTLTDTEAVIFDKIKEAGLVDDQLLELLKAMRKLLQGIESHPLNHFNDYYQIKICKLEFTSLIKTVVDELLLRKEVKLENEGEIDNNILAIIQSVIDELYNLKKNIDDKFYHIHIEFIKKVLNLNEPELTLFNDLTLTEENIIKRHKQLSKCFHPDIDVFLSDDHKGLLNKLTALINDHRDKKLQELQEKVESKWNLAFHREKGNTYWRIALDYNCAYKYKDTEIGEWKELELLKQEDIAHLSLAELEDQKLSYTKKAYEEYRACCKIADANKDLKNQIELRKQMALCLYVMRKGSLTSQLSAQLYALAAINLIEKNAQHTTQQDLVEAKKVLDKVKDIPVDNSKNNSPQLVIIDKKHLSNPERSLVISTYSPAERVNIQNIIGQELAKISNQLILKVKPDLVRYQTSQEEILVAQKSGYKHRIAGSTALIASPFFSFGLLATGIKEVVEARRLMDGVKFFKEMEILDRKLTESARPFITSSVLKEQAQETMQLIQSASENFSNYASSSKTTAAICIVGGIAAISVGILGGYCLFKKGNKILEEPEIRIKLNDIIQTAMKFYSLGNYQACIEELTKEYKTSASILPLSLLISGDFNFSDNIDLPKIINCLLKHGFRPDGIAYLLNIIAEIFISGKVSIKNNSEGDLKHIAQDILKGITKSQQLKETAAILDQRIRELRIKSLESFFKSYWHRIKDLSTFQPYSSIAATFIDKQNIRDAQEMPFKSRLEEMCNLAKLNIAIIRIAKRTDEELKFAKELIEEVKASIENNHQFFSITEIKLEALEDFLWVVSGQPVSEQEPAISRLTAVTNENFSNQETITEDYINYLDEEFKTSISTEQKVTILNKKADFYANKAQKEAKSNHFKSLRDWKEAQKTYQAALELNTKDLSAAMGFCKCLLKLSKHSEVVAFLKNNKNLSTTANYWLLASTAYRKKNDYKKAEECIVEALKIDKDNKEAHKERSLIKKLQQSNSKARLDLYKRAKPECIEEYLNYRKSDATPFYKILSIDGGGIRGIIPAVWLSEIERQTRRPISHLFNMMAGTSTGGIIAAGLSTPCIDIQHETRTIYDFHGSDMLFPIETISSFRPRYSAIDILELYTEKAPNIFTTNNYWFPLPEFLKHKTTTKYTMEGRLNVFREKFTNTRIRHVLTDLVIPAACEDNLTESYIFNRYDSHRDNSKNDALVDVLMATTAAPTFFPSYKIPGKGIFSDGGIHLNNPSATAYHEALRYGIPREKIFVLSMGTGSYIPDPLHPDLYRGQLFWAQNLHKVALPAQEGNTDIQMYHLLPKNRYQRWQAWLGEPITLDAYRESDINNLIEIGRQYVEELYASDDNTMNKLIEFLKYDTDMSA